MVEVDRMADKIAKDNGLREKIFSVDEIKFCSNQAKSGEHYAARFAAKEAFLKATGLGLTASFELRHIEIFHDDLGKPNMKLSGPFEKLANENHWQKIHVSLSHVKSMACAVVIIEG